MQFNIFRFLAVMFIASCSTTLWAQEATWQTLHADGMSAYQQGRYLEAEESLLLALESVQKLRGRDLDFALILNNLASLYRNLGRYAEAEPLYQHALGIREQALGPAHPDVATSLNYLAVI